MSAILVRRSDAASPPLRPAVALGLSHPQPGQYLEHAGCELSGSGRVRGA